MLSKRVKSKIGITVQSVGYERKKAVEIINLILNHAVHQNCFSLLNNKGDGNDHSEELE